MRSSFQIVSCRPFPWAAFNNGCCGLPQTMASPEGKRLSAFSLSGLRRTTIVRGWPPNGGGGAAGHALRRRIRVETRFNAISHLSKTLLAGVEKINWRPGSLPRHNALDLKGEILFPLGRRKRGAVHITPQPGPWPDSWSVFQDGRPASPGRMQLKIFALDVFDCRLCRGS